MGASRPTIPTWRLYLAALIGTQQSHCCFFLAANLLAGATAALWRVLVLWLRLDHPSFPYYTHLRPPAPWHYLFSGVDVVDFTPDAVVVAALVPLKESTYIFTGLLRDYELTDKGELERIVISQAARRRLEDDRKHDNSTSRLSPENFERFYWIEGDTLVLRASEFTTLNIKFLVLEPLNEASQGKKISTPQGIAIKARNAARINLHRRA